MKAFLMYADRDVDAGSALPSNEQALTQDLELNILFNGMALGDRFLFEIARKTVFSSVDSREEIEYRQQILRDCLEQPSIVREIYAIAVEGTEAEKKIWGGLFWHSPDGVLHQSLELLQLLIVVLKKLRHIAEEHAAKFQSPGCTTFFAMLARELDDEYLRSLEHHLRELRFRDGVLISAELDKGNKGTNFVVRRPRKRSWRERVPLADRSAYTFRIADRDEAGARALGDLRDMGLNPVANTVAQSSDHVRSFFRMLRAELGFYIGCLNLHEQLVQTGEPTCFPIATPGGAPALSFHELYDVCLALTIRAGVIGNDASADGKSLVMITGPNQGGKSTLLRSIGLAQLMMQSGMFVAAQSFRSNICQGVFTHFKREEDPTMKSGKLDEELSRMSDIADSMTPNSVLLCNESFASTNEREGSEIARQIIRALIETGIKVIFVTHMFDLADGFYRQQLASALFLRAERLPDGRRTFRVPEGEPLPTSYGEDLYDRIFGAVPIGSGAPKLD